MRLPQVYEATSASACLNSDPPVGKAPGVRLSLLPERGVLAPAVVVDEPKKRARRRSAQPLAD